MRREIIAMNYEEKNLVEIKCIQEEETILFLKLERVTNPCFAWVE